VGTAASPEQIYAIDVDLPARLSVEVLASDRPLTAYLLGPDAAPPRPACSAHRELACGAGPQPIQGILLDPERYFLVVDGSAAPGPGSFHLRVVLGDTPVARCAAARHIEPDLGIIEGTAAGQGAVFAARACDPAGTAASPEELLRFDLEREAALSVQVLGSERPTLLHIFSGPCDAPTELACGAQGIEHQVLPPGAYYLAVDGRDPLGPGAYSLRVTTARPGDRCDHPLAIEIPDGGGALRVSGSTLGAAADHGACAFDTRGPDLVYSLRLQRSMALRAEITADFPASAYLGHACAQGPMLACAPPGEGIALDRLEAGEYFLLIDSAGPSGSFDLELTLSPLPASRPNESTVSSWHRSAPSS
jgi:hypothetical protein